MYDEPKLGKTYWVVVDQKGCLVGTIAHGYWHATKREAVDAMNNTLVDDGVQMRVVKACWQEVKR